MFPRKSAKVWKSSMFSKLFYYFCCLNQALTYNLDTSGRPFAKSGRMLIKCTCLKADCEPSRGSSGLSP